MLKNLYIKNIALISELNVNFYGGLNVLSGETGAGKSVIIDSLNFVFGGKTDKSIIKSGENSAIVSAVFSLSEESREEFSKEFGIEFEDENILFSRALNADGRSDVRINGRPVTVSVLKALTSCIVDVHGQYEHQSLLKTSNHLKLLDKIYPQEKEKSEVGLYLEEYRLIRKELENFGSDESERARKLDMLAYQIEEIEKANLSEGEEEQLLTERVKINNLEKIIAAVSSAKEMLRAERGAAPEAYRAAAELDRIARYDPIFEPLYERLNSCRLELDDIADTLSEYLNTVEHDAGRADKIEARLDKIREVKRKYGGSVATAFDFLTKARKDLEYLTNSQERIEHLTKKLSETSQKLYAACLKLREVRQKSAQEFERMVSSELTELGMKNARFLVNFNELKIPSSEGRDAAAEPQQCALNGTLLANRGEQATELTGHRPASFAAQSSERRGLATRGHAIDEAVLSEVTSDGLDKIEFFFSANLGEEEKPLAKIISGGEMSRVMLAFKKVLAGKDGIGTMIFDEIDSGVSGKIGQAVAEKLAVLACKHQIICVTHLPIIAAFADNHYLLEKKVLSGKTVSNLYKLDSSGEIEEIARLAGGKDISALALKHAADMKAFCTDFKKKLM